MLDNMTWHSPPPKLAINGDTLTVETGYKTDLWNETFYGFRRLNGHFLYSEVTGDFSCEVTLHARFEELYDQLGLMVRSDDQRWLKTGLEYSDGAVQMSTVLTRDFSDWSASPVTPKSAAAGVRIRLTRHDDALRVQRQEVNGGWTLVRLGYLSLAKTCQVGLMCCSPEREGFNAIFSNFNIMPAIPRDLHV